MRRRQFLKVMASGAGAAMLPSCGAVPVHGKPHRRLLVLAFDGLDPRIVEDLMKAGRLPNMSAVKGRGSFKRLITSTPAQTPVAFSNIISGTDPGTHHIFDFIHRDPKFPPFGRPYLSISDTIPPSNDYALALGKWRLPFSGESTLSMRRGPTFWEPLIQEGIDTSVYYVPSNYPAEPVPGPGQFRCISGMGTPDLLGGYGEFTLFTPDEPAGRPRQVSGGQFCHLAINNHRGKGKLQGPRNPLLKPNPKGQIPRMTVGFEIVRDPVAKVAKIEIEDRKFLLKEGEWSDWVQIRYRTGIPGSAAWDAIGSQTQLKGIVRFYLKQVHPKLELYTSPVNIDPSDPLAKISEPEDFSKQLAREHGLFYTSGIPEDTKALTHGALTEEQFLEQCELVIEEQNDQYLDALSNFHGGCLFFYFGWPDLVQHMFWRDRDPAHPGRDPIQGDHYAGVVDDVYTRLDQSVGQALKVLDLDSDDTLMILSDHGFTTFRRGFNLNTWLVQNDYIKLKDPYLQAEAEVFQNVNWYGTKAYGLGMNTLYLNLIGREGRGAVPPGSSRSLLNEIREKLLNVRDEDGSAVIAKVDLVDELYPGADRDSLAPDLLIGYAEGYRASWDTILGGMPEKLIVDNLERWSGTHLLDADLIPGILITSRPVVKENPSLIDIAPSILSLFGVRPPSAMTGQSVFTQT